MNTILWWDRDPEEPRFLTWSLFLTNYAALNKFSFSGSQSFSLRSRNKLGSVPWGYWGIILQKKIWAQTRFSGTSYNPSTQQTRKSGVEASLDIYHSSFSNQQQTKNKTKNKPTNKPKAASSTTLIFLSFCESVLKIFLSFLFVCFVLFF